MKIHLMHVLYTLMLLLVLLALTCSGCDEGYSDANPQVWPTVRVEQNQRQYDQTRDEINENRRYMDGAGPSDPTAGQDWVTVEPGE